jgi:hypothetical protein
MVTRARLTSKSVDDAIVPVKGEKWIADTKVRGFGLRLIMTSAGPRKLLCVRTTNKYGKSVRKSFDIETARHYRQPIFLFEPDPEEIEAGNIDKLTLGDFVEEAREWASKEIAKLKGLKTLDDENADRINQFRNKLAEVTLEQGANSVLANYQKMNMTDAYLIHLSKLFSIHVPQNLKSTKLAEFTEEQATQLSNLQALKPGNRQSLRPFLAKIFDTFHALTLTRDNFAIAQRELRHVQYFYNEDQSNSNTKQTNFETLFEILEAEKQFWQQALCL